MSAFSPHNKPLVSIYPIIPQRSRQGFSPAPTTSHVTHTSISPVASKLHIQYCQHFPCCFQVTHASIFPCCIQVTHASIFPAASKLHMPAFSLLQPGYTCQYFPCCIQATHATLPLSLLHPSYTCQHFPCPKATHTISISSITSTATHNRKLLHNNLIKLVERVNNKSVNIHDTGDTIHRIQHKVHNRSLKKNMAHIKIVQLYFFNGLKQSWLPNFAKKH